MKSQIKQLSLLFLSMLFMFTSCQNESVEETDPQTEGELVTQNSEVANLVLNMATRDGSGDNILDRNHCTEIKLPVTVVINDIEIIIDSEEDLETIERIFDEFEDDLDELDFLFPVTIILADHSEVVIENQEALEALIEECEEDDDDIECIDFEYPITVSVFDDNNEQIGTETFENDTQLYRFFKNLNENEFVSFNFPMVLVDSEGEEVTINDNDELVEAIRVARNECDEDDDDDFNDDDFSIERLENYLVECPFAVQHFRLNGDDLTEQYFRYVVKFNEDGTLIASRQPGGVPVEGEWEIKEGENGRPLVFISIGQLTDFNNEWLVYEIDDDKIKLFDGDSRIILHQRCDDDNEESCDTTEVANKLETCKWRVAKIDGNEGFSDFLIDFSNRNIHAYINGMVEDEGNWDITDTAINFNDLFANLQVINGSWTVVECEADRLVMINEAQNELILEKDCADNGEGAQFTEEQFKSIILECGWKVGSLELGPNAEAVDVAALFTFKEDQKVFAQTSNDVPAEEKGSWSLQDNGNGELFFLWDMEAPYAGLGNDWVVSILEDDKIKLVSGDYFVILDKRDCPSESDIIQGYLSDGKWEVTAFEDTSNPNFLVDNYDGYSFTFDGSDKLVATNANMEETIGGYDLIRNDNGMLELTIRDFVQPDVLEILDGNFDVLEVSENRLEVKQTFSTESTKRIVFEKVQ